MQSIEVGRLLKVVEFIDKQTEEAANLAGSYLREALPFISPADWARDEFGEVHPSNPLASTHYAWEEVARWLGLTPEQGKDLESAENLKAVASMLRQYHQAQVTC